jgi:hypothetical protein
MAWASGSSKALESCIPCSESESTGTVLVNLRDDAFRCQFDAKVGGREGALEGRDGALDSAFALVTCIRHRQIVDC